MKDKEIHDGNSTVASQVMGKFGVSGHTSTGSTPGMGTGTPSKGSPKGGHAGMTKKGPPGNASAGPIGKGSMGHK